jgi:hypothetical protein
MPKKTKNRSSKQAKQHRQDKARAARQDLMYDAIEKASTEAFPAAVAVGEFTVLTDDGPRTVTLEQMRQRVDADLTSDPGEPPLEDMDELVGMLEDDLRMRQIFLAPDGLWRFPEAYLPKAGQA